jgi:hypothetical protein
MADSDRRSTLLDSYENAAVIVSGIDADELGHPTPCPTYDVAGLIDHLVEAGHRAAALGRGQAPPPGDESPHVELSDAPGQLRSAAEEAAHAWDLARATGQIDKLDPSLALPTLERARAMIKPQYRNMVEPGAPFGADVYPAPGEARSPSRLWL